MSEHDGKYREDDYIGTLTIEDEQYEVDKAVEEFVCDLSDEIERLREESERVCEWRYNRDGFWDGACGIAFELGNEYSLEENDIIYCQKCGGKIKEVFYCQIKGENDA